MRVDVQRNDGFCNIEIEWEAPEEVNNRSAALSLWRHGCHSRPMSDLCMCAAASRGPRAQV